MYLKIPRFPLSTWKDFPSYILLSPNFRVAIWKSRVILTAGSLKVAYLYLFRNPFIPGILKFQDDVLWERFTFYPWYWTLSRTSQWKLMFIVDILVVCVCSPFFATLFINIWVLNFLDWSSDFLIFYFLIFIFCVLTVFSLKFP